MALSEWAFSIAGVCADDGFSLVPRKKDLTHVYEKLNKGNMSLVLDFLVKKVDYNNLITEHVPFISNHLKLEKLNQVKREYSEFMEKRKLLEQKLAQQNHFLFTLKHENALKRSKLELYRALQTEWTQWMDISKEYRSELGTLNISGKSLNVEIPKVLPFTKHDSSLESVIHHHFKKWQQEHVQISQQASLTELKKQMLDSKESVSLEIQAQQLQIMLDYLTNYINSHSTGKVDVWQEYDHQLYALKKRSISTLKKEQALLLHLSAEIQECFGKNQEYLEDKMALLTRRTQESLVTYGSICKNIMTHFTQLPLSLIPKTQLSQNKFMAPISCPSRVVLDPIILKLCHIFDIPFYVDTSTFLKLLEKKLNPQYLDLPPIPGNVEELNQQLEEEMSLLHDYTHIYIPQLKQCCHQAQEGREVYQLMKELIEQRQQIPVHEMEQQLSDLLNALE